MHTLSFLNSKELKSISAIVKNQWDLELPKDYFYLLRKDGDIFIVNRDVEKIDLSQLRINSLGLYIGELRNEEIRLSIEGAQILGPSAKKNIVKITKEQLSQWLRGEDLDFSGNETGYVLLKHQKDFVGCGKVSNNRILNFVPKVRRVKASYL